MPPARQGERSLGKQRRQSTRLNTDEEGASTRNIWDSISSFHVGNDGLKDVLEQDRPPLPLLPDVMGIMETMSASNRRMDNLFDAASQPETVRRISSDNEQQSHPDSLDSPTLVKPWLLEKPGAAQRSPIQSSPDQETSQSSSSSSASDTDYQALLDQFELPHDSVDTLQVDWAQMDVDNLGDLDQFMADTTQDTNNAPSVENADTDTRCWEHGCNGKKFSTRSNLIRHQLEKGKARPNYKCPLCDAYFSRSTARNQHVEKRSCNRVRRYSNGRERPRPRIRD